MKLPKQNRFADLKFEDFKNLAKDESLSKYEKIGFPDIYRKDYEDYIFQDILRKLDNLLNRNRIVLDIGPGCSELPQKLIELCKKNEHTLYLSDSKEMLDLLPNDDFINKIYGSFPNNSQKLKTLERQIDVIIVYSVLQYVFVEGNFFSFLDKSLELLSPGGQILLGDIPNISKRKRFFHSNSGRNFHRAFIGKDEELEISYNNIEKEQIDDSVIMSIFLRARQQGFDAYIMPQHKTLPMENRREDILIIRP